jgi:hypothetical protein
MNSFDDLDKLMSQIEELINLMMQRGVEYPLCLPLNSAVGVFLFSKNVL